MPCDCCGKEKPAKAQAIGPKKYYLMCDQCIEEAKKANTPAHRWLEEKRKEK